MVLSCEYCKYSTKIKCNFMKHLKTKKHENNVSKHIPNLFSKNTCDTNFLQNPPKSSEIYTFSLQNPPNSEGKIYTFSENFKCHLCSKVFSRQDNLKRHQQERCKKTNEIKDIVNQITKQHEKEKNDLKKQIEILLNKVGNTTNNTTINNTQNIQLNNYGSEDLSHITNKLKTEMIKMPYGMIPKMIEHVHFNNDKPENKNIYLSNTRDNKIKVFTDNKWVFKNKIDTINDLVDGKYFILDNHYEDIQDKLNKSTESNYLKFRQIFDKGDKELIEKIRKDCELLLLNNR